MNGSSFSLCVLRIIAVVLAASCTKQGGLTTPREHGPPPVSQMEWGRSVVRYETFGNELFWSDVLGLSEGLANRAVTPNALLAAGLRFDGDKLPSFVRRAEVGLGPYTDPGTTWPLLDANAVIGLVRRGERVGVTCALCHTTVDDRIGPGVGRRVDGAPNAELHVGELIAWGDRSRAYLPFLNTDGMGRGPRVDLSLLGSARSDAEALLERQTDAGLLAWPPGQADTSPDGVGNPTEIPAIFNLQDVGPYTWTGVFDETGPVHNYFFSVVLEPTTLATPEGRSFLRATAGAAGRTLASSYPALLAVLDPEGPRPKLTAKPSGGFALFRRSRDVGLEVDRDDLHAISAYLARMLPPPPVEIDEEAIDAGRRVFRATGCNECHAEDRKTTGRVVPITVLMPGYHPRSEHGAAIDERGADDPQSGYDDAQISATLRTGERSDRVGYKVPQLLGLGMTAPYLHDGSISSLDLLFSPARGPLAPHPFYVRHPDERADLVSYLMAWDGRSYP